MGRLSAYKGVVDSVFSNPFGILGLLETLFSPEKLWGALQCFENKTPPSLNRQKTAALGELHTAVHLLHLGLLDSH